MRPTGVCGFAAALRKNMAACGLPACCAYYFEQPRKKEEIQTGLLH
jgi:hypothetical protein